MTKEEIIDGLEIYIVGKLNKDKVNITVEELQKFIDAIKALPPVIPKVKKAKKKPKTYNMEDFERDPFLGEGW